MVAKSQQSEEHASLQFIQGELKCDHSYAQYKMTLKVFLVKKKKKSIQTFLSNVI